MFRLGAAEFLVIAAVFAFLMLVSAAAAIAAALALKARSGRALNRPPASRLWCPSCGREIDSADRFCRHCGAKMLPPG
jgi:hypothetical protein